MDKIGIQGVEDWGVNLSRGALQYAPAYPLASAPAVGIYSLFPIPYSLFPIPYLSVLGERRRGFLS